MYADLPASKKLQMRNGKPGQVLEKKKTMKQKRLNGIDAAKGLAIMMVVLGHCADKNGPDRVLLHFSMFTGVGVFFLLSGAAFCWRDGVFPWFDQRTFRSFAKGLWRSLILPYLIWGSVSVAIYGVLGRYAAAELSSDRHHFDIGPNLLGMLYGNSGSGFMEWNRPLWFLVCLVWVELIWYFLLRSSQVKCLYLCAMTIPFVWLSAQNMTGIHLCLPWELETAVCVLPYFGAGRLLRGYAVRRKGLRNGEKTRNGGKTISVLTALAGAAALALLWILLKGVQDADFRADRFTDLGCFFPDMLLGAFGILALAQLFSGPGPVGKWIRYLGQRTLAVLVMHKFPVMAMKLLLRNRRESILTDAGMMIVSVLLCLLAERILSRICPAVFGKRKGSCGRE